MNKTIKVSDKKLSKKCIGCGVVFTVNLGRGSQKKFCTRICCTRNINKRHLEKNKAKARQRLIDNPIEERKMRAEQARNWRKNKKDNYLKANRERNGTGELASEDEILFYGYKEPLRKFVGGYGYQGVLRFNKAKDKVQCHFCGRLFRAINNGHLQKIHGLTASLYKEKVGLSPSASLVGESTREKLYNRPYNPDHMVELKKIHENRRKVIKNTGKDPQSHPKLSLEVKNKRGTCPDQLLDIIEKTAKSYGHTPTAEEFLSFHKGKYMGSIRKTYGTWTNALSKLNMRPHMVVKTREELIKEIQNFYQVHKRTPRWTDFERGLLSGSGCFYRKFKSLNEARLLAGVPLIIQTGRMREEWKYTDEEKHKMLSK